MILNGIYNTYPAGYVRQLKQEGKRGLAAAFLEYYDDYLAGDVQAARFYADRWTADGNRKRKEAGMSHRTAQAWIDHFEERIAIFQSALDLNLRHQKKSAKNSIAHLLPIHCENKPSDNDASLGAIAHELPAYCPKSIKINDVVKAHERTDEINNSFADRDFRMIWDTYAVNNPSSMGKREEAYQAWLAIKGRFGADDIRRTIKFYIHDAARVVGGKRMIYNVANFLKNEAFTPYLSKRIRFVTKDGTAYEGVFDPTEKIVTTTNGERLALTEEKASELFRAKRLEFLNEEEKGAA